jgi:photosystem II stability/assembly factor-like uncharacterized protein
MKRLTFIFFTLFLAACATPRTQVPPTLAAVPATSSPTVSLPAETPIPTPSLAPQGTPALTASPQQPGILSIMRLQMIDANVGWAEGGASSDGMPNPNVNSDASFYLLRTADGGETWQDVTPPTWFGSSQGYGTGIGLSAIDANTAWAISSDYPFSDTPPYTVVWRTTDGGRSWSPSNPISTVSGWGQLEFSPWLQFVDEKHGWLTLHFQRRIESNDLQYRTSDGGITWDGMSGCYTWDGDRWGCNVPQYTDSQTGWLRSRPDYTSNGEVVSSSIWRVQRTLDGGQSWQNISLPHSQEAAECYQNFTRVGAGMVGLRVDCSTPDGSTESYYYLSADRGQTWRSLPLPGKAFSLIPPTQAFETSYINVSTTSNVFFLDMTTGWRLSALNSGYQLERTRDGGATWQTMSDHLDWKEGFQFVDADLGWEVLMDFSDHPKLELQRTGDGGKTWNKLTPRLLPADQERPAIARLEPGYPPAFKSIQMIDSLNGWAIGANGYVFHTDDGGKNWQDITPQHGYIFAKREFFALDAWQAWTTISSSYEMIWYTKDGGQSWHPTSALSEMNGQYVLPTNIQFLDKNTGWFQWNDRQEEFHLMKTKNNGATWESQITGQNPPDYMGPIGFVFLDEKNGFRTEPIAEHTLEELLKGSAILAISKTTNGGDSWQPVNLPKMVMDPAEISLNETLSPGNLVYPDGVKELMKDTFSCDQNTLQTFAPDIISLKVVCVGASREGKPVGAADTVYSVEIVESYLSTDAGESWNNWMSIGYDLYSWSVSNETARIPFETMFVIGNGTGWRMDSGDDNRSGRLQRTADGGRTWTVIKTVGWQEAHFDFVDQQTGWALVTSQDTTALVHTIDGGQTWEEIRPVIANP